MTRVTRRADAFARAQRAKMPPAELRLWSRLRRDALGHRFRRQHAIGPYYADFACADLRLVVECDGDQHGRDPAPDHTRDAYMRARGWTVLRLPNAYVLRHTDDAVEAVANACRELALAKKHGARG